MKVQIVPHSNGGYAFLLFGDPSNLHFGHYPTRDRAQAIAAMNFFEVVDPSNPTPTKHSAHHTREVPLPATKAQAIFPIAIIAGAILAAAVVCIFVL